MDVHTRLSVNLNKVALIRNARGSDFPNLIQISKDCERFGAEGITVHPRPDERHIRMQDVRELVELVETEFNVEGYPSKDFIQLMQEVRPDQVTLVPDPPDALTSSEGWDTIGHADFLKDVIAALKESGARVSLFMETKKELLDAAKVLGTDRIEFYTGPYALNYTRDREAAIAPYVEAAYHARDIDLDLNAGHDLNLHNLAYWKEQIPHTLEVSIGHALWVDAIYYGLDNTIAMYLQRLKG
jgi:pyridoxine 5-phosphate synthase